MKFVQATTINRGKPSAEAVENLFAAGYNKGNVVDILIVIGDKIISNYLHGVGQFAIDFPLAQELETVAA